VRADSDISYPFQIADHYTLTIQDR
jgi:hypothetical protein